MSQTLHCKLLFINLLAIIFAVAANAQSLKTYERAGDKAFEKKDFNAAIQYYATVLAGDRDNLAVQWKYAESAMHFFAFGEAERALKKIEASKKGRAKFPLLDFRLGAAKKAQGQYEEAATYFERFLSNAEADEASKQQAKVEIENCRFALALVQNVPKIEVQHPGKEINSPFSDFAPVLLGDTLFFSAYKFDKKNDHAKPKSKISKMLASIKGSRAREIGRGFPAPDSVHVANGAITNDGHFFFFTFCKNLNVSDIRCELYLSVKNKRGTWSKPQRLPESINAKSCTTTQPAIGFDAASKKQVLWFASDRPGGKGKLDLWSVPLDSAWFCPCQAQKFDGKKDPKLPAFADPTNLADLNTPGNDATPFFHTPSQTLYFSSDERPGLGGYDIFSAKKSGTSFAPPENAGLGLNSAYNDLYPALRPDGKSGYFSSNRPGVFFLDEANKACCNDIFSFKVPENEPLKPSPKIPPTTAGTPPPEEKTPQNSVPALPGKPQAPATSQAAPTPPLEFQPPKLTDFVGLPLYFDNDEPDKRTRRTTTKKSYEETVTAYLERQQEYRERYATGLESPRKEEAEDAVEAYFEDEVRRGYDRLFQLSDLILSRLQNGERIEVFIKGFTSPRAQSDYNLNLGRRRISSVRNHFETYAEGVLQPFLRSGQLKITETSFGETTARAGISDDLRDERNSIYSPEAARERRVEIVEIKS